MPYHDVSRTILEEIITMEERTSMGLLQPLFIQAYLEKVRVQGVSNVFLKYIICTKKSWSTNKVYTPRKLT